MERGATIHLDGTITEPATHKRVLSDLGDFYSTWLRTEWKHPSFAFVQGAFDDYFSPTADGLPAVAEQRRYTHRLRSIRRAEYVTFDDAAHSLDTKTEVVERLVKCRRLSTKWFRRGRASTGYRQLILRRDVEELQHRWCHLLTIDEVCKWLGVQQSDVPDMVYRGLLLAERGPCIDGSNDWVFSRQGVIDCQTKMLQPIQQAEPRTIELGDEERWLSLTEAAERLAAGGCTVAGILSMVAEGILPAWLEPPDPQVSYTSGAINVQHGTLQSLRFRSCDIDTCLERNTDSPEVRLDSIEVAARMGMSTHFACVKWWVQVGVLSAIREESEHGYQFTPTAVDRFVAEYLLTGGAAAILRVSPQKVNVLVRTKRLLPVSGPGVDGSRWHLFRRKDLELLAGQLLLHV
jgi:hypothetical protein